MYVGDCLPHANHQCKAVTVESAALLITDSVSVQLMGELIMLHSCSRLIFLSKAFMKRSISKVNHSVVLIHCQIHLSNQMLQWLYWIELVWGGWVCCERCFLPCWGPTMGSFHTDMEVRTPTVGNIIIFWLDIYIINRNTLLPEINECVYECQNLL